MALAQRAETEKSGGQADMFGGSASAPEPLRGPAVEPWEPSDRLQREFDAIGFFLSGHPLDAYGTRSGAPAGAVLGAVRAEGEAGRLGRAPRRDRAVAGRAQDADRHQDGRRHARRTPRASSRR